MDGGQNQAFSSSVTNTGVDVCPGDRTSLARQGLEDSGLGRRSSDELQTLDPLQQLAVIAAMKSRAVGVSRWSLESTLELGSVGKFRTPLACEQVTRCDCHQPGTEMFLDGVDKDEVV